MDRHLEEALTYGPDPLHLADVFGISPSTAHALHHHRQAAPESRLRSATVTRRSLPTPGRPGLRRPTGTASRRVA